jgi:hypothetical protein
MADRQGLAPVLGAAERALSALLTPVLTESQLSFAAWTALFMLEQATSLTREQLVERQLDAAVAVPEELEIAIDELLGRGLLGTEGQQLVITPAGERFFAPLRQRVANISQSVWGDLPEADLEATRRTLGEVTKRAQDLAAQAA